MENADGDSVLKFMNYRSLRLFSHRLTSFPFCIPHGDEPTGGRAGGVVASLS